jgi:hypothetical protein
MSFMDKAKQSAQQALDEAKKGIDAGQAKLDEYQAKRESERLLATLGSAYFQQQRHGGSAEAVQQAILNVDAHIEEHGMVGFPQSPGTDEDN